MEREETLSGDAEDNRATATVNSNNNSEETQVGGRYANYVLVVLVLVYVFNFIDRQILSILAEEIKADLGISDADIGFLYGTAFAVFYAIFGIPLGRLADVWVRKNLISVGLGFWSLMTALSGTAKSFTSLATFRFGVGIGEASASPAAYSMLSDYYPPRLRATVLSIYSSGVYIGAGIGIFLGGWIVNSWAVAYPDAATAPFGIKPWQAAFLAVGLPGLLMACWVATLKEPTRGVSEGIKVATHPHPFREAFRELMSVLPPFTIFSLLKNGGSSRTLVHNLSAATVIALLGWWLVHVTESVAQWTALSIGVYAAYSWVQGLALRDPATFALMFRCKAFVYSMIGFPAIGFVSYGVGFWSTPYFLRAFNLTIVEAGTILGLSAAVGGWLGVTLGGILADRFRARTAGSRIYMGVASVILGSPFIIGMLLTSNLILAYIMNFLAVLFAALWVGAAATTANELVMPRMRASASAFYILMITFLGLALGPFLIGQVSDFYMKSGAAPVDALRQALLLSLITFVVAAGFLLMASRHIEADLASRLDRARALGEPV